MGGGTDDDAGGARVEAHAGVAVGEAGERWVGGVEVSHAFFEFGDLGQLAELGFVFVEEDEEGCGSGDVFGLGGQFGDGGFEDGAGIWWRLSAMAQARR